MGPTETLINAVLQKMSAVDAGDTRRIFHFLKVYALARSIGLSEGLAPETQTVLELAAILHDAGIHLCEQKYGSTAGPYQELEGPDVAASLLAGLEIPEELRDRILFLVGHHHSLREVDGPDYRILLEADFLVNSAEEEMNAAQIASAREHIFRTQTGLFFLNTLYPEQKEGSS